MAMSGSDISVIIPVYNREATLRRTLDSIASQSVMPGEIIIVDNNSTDGSKSVAEQFADEFTGCRVLIADCSKRGASAARNAGAELASGRWLLFFDSDDIMYPSLVSTYVDALNDDAAYSVAVVPQHFRFFDGSLKVVNHPIHGDAVVSQILHTIVTTNNMLVRESAYNEVGGWNETLPSWNDWEFGLRLMLRYAQETLFLRNVEPQLCHILIEKSITGTGFSHHLDDCLHAISVACTDVCKSPNRQLYELLLVYKRMMLAAQVSREGNVRGVDLRRDILNSLPSQSLRAIFASLYHYISAGLPGASRLALSASRIYLKLK